MKYKHIEKAEFLRRDNRFIATVKTPHGEEKVHVKNTGRCGELFIEGATVFIEKTEKSERKTKYDLVTVEKTLKDDKKMLVNVDSQLPNDLVDEYLKKSDIFSKNAEIFREKTYGDSRFDFYIKDGKEETYMEVKGVNLENDGEVLFPDAPTVRGLKHLCGLIKARENGYRAIVFFVVQLERANIFTPNYKTDANFAKALREAKEKGIEIIVKPCEVTSDEVKILDRDIKINI